MPNSVPAIKKACWTRLESGVEAIYKEFDP